VVDVLFVPSCLRGELNVGGRARFLYHRAMPQDPIDAMTRDFAAAAVEMARSMQVELDYSEQSLERVEEILARLHDEARDWRIAGSANRALSDAPAPAGPDASQMDDMCKLWGSYFGEVVRRKWGGEWSIETYPGAGFATLTLSVTAGKLFPSIKVYRRLTEGDSDNLWTFYQSVRARLEQKPGATVN
jgi:hypothetical protein